uniref:Uncharacterized protein n=1 Tax=Rhizophora mucronata TaxID=61149 RepID=A0A2P2NDH6_RHIMU
MTSRPDQMSLERNPKQPNFN